MMEPSIVLTHAAVIDVAGGAVRRDSVVAITGSRLTAVRRSADFKVPEGARVIDLSGKFIIPGLWDTHVHTEDETFLHLYLANGVTGIRDMGIGSLERLRTRLAWRDEIQRGCRLGPHIVTAGPMLDGPYPIIEGSFAAVTEEQARMAVAASARQGADFVKIYTWLQAEPFFAAAREGERLGIPVVGHCPEAVSAIDAAQVGLRSMEHVRHLYLASSTIESELRRALVAAAQLPRWAQARSTYHETLIRALDTFDGGKAQRMIDRFVQCGTWQCPTLAVLWLRAHGDSEQVREDPRRKYVPKAILQSWDDSCRVPDWIAQGRRLLPRALELIGHMHREGVRMLAGSDSPFVFPGSGLHDELGLLVEAGLSPLEALRAATIGAAGFLGQEGAVGTVEEGKLADIVVLDADPLMDIGNVRKIHAVAREGRLLTRTELDALLLGVEAQVYAAARLP